MLRSLSNSALIFLLATGAPVAPLGIDLQGKPIQQLNLPDTRLVVLFFAASDCPISNRYVPEISRLRDEFAAQHVAFWWVFPNPADTSEIVREHQRQFAADGNTILDTEQTLVRMAGVTTTPEAAVFAVTDGRLREIYRGRVDDRYLSLGQERPQAKPHDLEAAISSALDDKRISPSVTRSVGCSIMPLRAMR